MGRSRDLSQGIGSDVVLYLARGDILKAMSTCVHCPCRLAKRFAGSEEIRRERNGNGTGKKAVKYDDQSVPLGALCELPRESVTVVALGYFTTSRCFFRSGSKRDHRRHHSTQQSSSSVISFRLGLEIPRNYGNSKLRLGH